MARTFETLTDTAKETLVLAQREAQRLEHSRVGTGHLVLGLTGERDDLAARLLRESGARQAALRTALIERLKLGNTPAGVIDGLTKRAKMAIVLATAESERHKDLVIGTEHLLYGVLREEQGAGVGILVTAGVDVAALRTRLAREMIGGSEPTVAP